MLYITSLEFPNVMPVFFKTFFSRSEGISYLFGAGVLGADFVKSYFSE